jgi:antitoxin component of RelBE/YafQ-DinJ toxin-antitoxin module
MEKLKHRIVIRLTQMQKDKLDSLMLQYNMTISEVIRMLLQEHTATATATVQDEDDEL